MTLNTRLSRRTLIQVAALLTPVAVTGCAAAPKNSAMLLDADDPVARALLYYPNTKNVPADHPLAAGHQPGQTCATCIHVREEVSNGVHNCPTFPGRLVNAEGWCSVWAKAR